MNLRIIVIISLFTNLSCYSIMKNPLKISTIESPPFIFKDEENKIVGYIPELIKEITKRLNVSYKFALVQDSRYGAKINEKEWNGLMGEVIRKEVDMAAAPLTITEVRSKEVDFSVPFMSSELGIISKKAVVAKEGYNDYLVNLFRPFSATLWLTLFIMAIFSGVIMLGNAKFNPSEKQEGFSAGEHFLVIINGGRYPGKVWFPQSYFGRIYLTIWGIFCLFIVISYCICLYKGQISSQETLPTDFERLVTSVADGTYIPLFFTSGSTASYFKLSNISPHRIIYNAFIKELDTTGWSGPRNTDEAIERVRRTSDKNYVFFMESPLMDYHKQKAPCDLAGVRLGLKPTYYGFIFPLNSAWRKPFDAELLQLQRERFMDRLYEKWFFTMGDCSSESNSPSYLGPMIHERRLYSLLILYCLGCLLALLGGVVDILRHRFHKESESISISPPLDDTAPMP